MTKGGGSVLEVTIFLKSRTGRPLLSRHLSLIKHPFFHLFPSPQLTAAENFHVTAWKLIIGKTREDANIPEVLERDVRSREITDAFLKWRWKVSTPGRCYFSRRKKFSFWKFAKSLSALLLHKTYNVTLLIFFSNIFESPLFVYEISRDRSVIP